MSVCVQHLGDMSTITMGTSPKGSTYNESEEGLPLLNGPTEFGPHHPACTLYTTDPKRECEPGDLIFCVRGSTTGRMNWADQKYALGRGVCSFRGRSQEDTYFIRYALEVHLRRLLQFAGGATFPNLKKDTLHDFTIPFPNNRGKIVDVLSAYDDLIENNRRRIQLLEQATRLLYREWFVHLRFPGHEHATITDGVPEGWKQSTVSGLGKIVTGKTPSTKTPENFGGNIPFVKTPDMHRSRVIVETEEFLSERGANTQANKTLPVGSILVACIGARLGVVSITCKPCQTNQQINAVIPSNGHYRYYGLFALIDIKPRLEAMGGGATMPNVNKSKFASIPILIPSQILLQEFQEFASYTFQQIQLLHQQNVALTQARDLLLPRLMNGEVAV